MVYQRKLKVAQPCLTLCNPMDYTVLQARILEWVAFPFSRIFPTQGSNPGLLHCRWILYQLSLDEPALSGWSVRSDLKLHVLCLTHLKGNQASCTVPLVKESEFSKYSFPLQLQPPISSSFFPLHFYFLQIFPFLMYKRGQFSNHPLFMAFRI